MGACAGKLRQVPEEKEAANSHLNGLITSFQNDLPVIKGRTSGNKRKSTLDLWDEENSVQEVEAATELPLRHEISVELAQVVDHWEANGNKLHGLSSEELANRYHQDNGVILSAIEHLEQSVRHTQQQLKTPGSCRDVVAVAEHWSDDLQPGTPPAALDTVQQSGRSQESSCQADAECKESEAPVSALRRMLSRAAGIAAAKQHFEGGRMLAAEKGLKEWSARHSLMLSELMPHSDAIGFDLSELKSHCERIHKMLQMLADEKGYSVSRDQDGLRVLYKCEHGRVHYIKMEAVLPHPLERPLALAREFDLMSSWNHYVLDSSLLHAPTIWQSWVYAALWMPFPFPQMDALAKGRGYDLSEEDHSLLVSMESLAPEELPPGAQKLPPRAAKRKHVKVMPGSLIRFEALPPAADGAARTKGTILAIVDPHIPHVPAFLINFVLRVVAPFAHHQIERLLEHEFDDPSKPFPRRIAAHPELYGRVRTAVSEGLKRHYSIQSVTS